MGGVALVAEEVAWTHHTLVAFSYHRANVAVRACCAQVMVGFLSAPWWEGCPGTFLVAQSVCNYRSEFLSTQGTFHNLLPH